MQVWGQGGCIFLPAFLNSLLAQQRLFHVDRYWTNGRMRTAIKLMGSIVAAISCTLLHPNKKGLATTQNKKAHTPKFENLPCVDIRSGT
jgi:hypothetical protein